MSALIPNRKPADSLVAKAQTLPTAHDGLGSPRPRDRAKPWPVVRFVISVTVAAIADSLQVAFPPLWIPMDIVAGVLFLALWGWRTEMVLFLIPELFPVTSAFPCWVALALFLGVRNTPGAPIRKSEDPPKTS